MIDLNSASVKDAFAKLAKEYGTTYVKKSNSDMMQAVARLLEALGVVDREEFLKEYSTTVGYWIYVPFKVGSRPPELIQQVMVCAHEHQHVVVMEREAPAIYNSLYVISPSMRAAYEAECYRAEMEVYWWYTKAVRGQPELLSVSELAGRLRYYGCSAKDVAMAQKSLEKAAKVVMRGGVSCRPAITVIKHFGWDRAAAAQKEKTK